MIHETLAGLVRANLAASAAVLLVLMLRKPVRAQFGAQVGYGLWAVVPVAAAAAFAPRPLAGTAIDPIVLTAVAAGARLVPQAMARAPSLAGLLLAAWVVGVLAAAFSAGEPAGAVPGGVGAAGAVLGGTAGYPARPT